MPAGMFRTREPLRDGDGKVYHKRLRRRQIRQRIILRNRIKKWIKRREDDAS